MDRDQVAAVLAEVGTLLELQGESKFRVNAYHNGARAVQQMEEDLGEVVRQGRLTEIPGIGETLRDKITTLVTTGKLPLHEKLKAEIPAGVVQMLRIPGLGPKKVMALRDQLGIDALDKLKAACEAGSVAKLKGFGAKTQQKILEGLAFVEQVGDRVRIDQAEHVAAHLADGLKGMPGIIRLEVCGSIRRRKETVKDIDLLASSADAGPIMERFVKLPGVISIAGQGETKSSVVVRRVLPSGTTITMNADLRVVPDDVFPFAQHYFTGSKEHGIAMRQRAIAQGMKFNEYGLEGEKRRVAARTEADIFAGMGLAYIPPELREGTGEMEAAEAKTLPKLVELSDIKGVFHNHTTYSDGANTLAEMAEAAQEMGLEFLGIADHSQSLTVANGLKPERLLEQMRQIDKLNKKLDGLRIFKGSEVDILQDGSLDFDDDILGKLDYVVASVHSYFAMPRDEMTARIIRAIRHPKTTMLGHATGRLLLKRDAYQVDLDAVLHAAAEAGTMIEINADPHRLDLDWVHCKRARALGVRLVVNPDAHSTGGLRNYRFGVDVARRG
ncbi:MAG: DNA polymerase/3'-5' exonuclease PolX, partial [Gemmataceae bacterium]|nr:DNA polymerase/3'-5' exonuclease PolX [Gemmataceae bacterium]